MGVELSSGVSTRGEEERVWAPVLRNPQHLVAEERGDEAAPETEEKPAGRQEERVSWRQREWAIMPIE